MVVGGGNDAARKSFDPDRLRADLLALAQPLHDAGALVVTIGLFDLARSGLVGPAWAEVSAERFDLLDSITVDVAREVGALHVDTHHHPRASDPSIFASDRMHANTRGHAIAFAAVVRALARRAAGPRRRAA